MDKEEYAIQEQMDTDAAEQYAHEQSEIAKMEAEQHLDFENKMLKAISFATEKHHGQKDDEGKDYFEAHCIKVYEILDLLKCKEDVLIAALLHDTLEDTNTTYTELIREFGEEIAYLVGEVTHDGKPDGYGYYFPRLKSKEAIMIKFADRLSNLSRMGGWSEKRQQAYLNKSKFWRSE